jgi:hypothetical protein
VAGLTSQRRAVGALLGHAIFEFPVMRIRVAGGAAAVFEAKRHDLVSAACRSHFVAIGAGHRGMGSRQCEASFAMLRDGKERTVKIAYGVAILAFVEIGGCGELAVMRILVTVRAKREFHLVNGVLAGRKMTLVTGNGNVFALQWVLGCVVFLHSEQGRFPPIQRMAFGAFALFRPGFELAFVRIGCVAIHAIREGKRFLEIAIDVTGGAADCNVFANQGILRLRVVEFKARKKFFPPRRCVAVLAALFERSFVRIDMAVDARLELHVFVTRRSAGHVRLVALLAGNLDVQTGQWIAGLRMVKLVCRFPVCEVMTLQTIVSELALVHVLVAGHAILRQSEKGPREIFHLDERALIGHHVAGHVAFLAGHVGMLAFQLVARLQVIELILRRLPVDQPEVFSVVLQVAADAIPAVRILHSQPGVVAMIRRKTLRNLFVAIEALEGRRAGPELMATRALGGSAQGLMSFGKGARRNLCLRYSRGEEKDKNKKKKIPRPS